MGRTAGLFGMTDGKELSALYSGINSTGWAGKEQILKIYGMISGGSGEAFFRKDDAVSADDRSFRHRMPPCESVPGRMNELLNWMGKTELPVLISSCIFRYEMEFIHPFGTRNGMITDVMQTQMLASYDPVFGWVSVASAVSSNINSYEYALRESSVSGESTLFVEYMLGLIADALKELESDLRDSKRTHGLTDHDDMIYELIKNGGFRNSPEAAAVLGISVPTVSRSLKRLTEEGLIRREGSRKTGRWTICR